MRLAQDFAVRYPLVDGQGNFGNIDGDNAAAYRYTEARMTEVATLLLEGIDEDAVDFRATYNEEDKEPVVLPGAFPNLLANGSTGIAVGMATSIPPHNAAELCDAAVHLIENPDASIEELVENGARPGFPHRRHHRRGPRVDPRILPHRPWRIPCPRPLAYGRHRPRHLAHHRHRNSLPGAEVAADREDRRTAFRQAQLPLLEDIRDESAEDVRVVIEPKSRTVDPGLLMESLFKLTELESAYLAQHERAFHGPRAAASCR